MNTLQSIRSLMMVVMRKELVDGFRDHRALWSALIFPLLGPVMISVMLSVVTSEEELEGALELPVIGAEHAPNLMDFLQSHGVEIQDPIAEPEKAVETGEVAMVLRVSEDFAKDFTDSQPATLDLVLDGSKRSTQVSRNRLEMLLQAYNGQVASLRLLSRGMNPTVVQALSIQTVDLATPQTKASNILEMIGMFLIMAAFGCNMYIAIDATAGERERGSIEPLLIQPVSRWALVLGKWFSTIVFGVIGGILTLICLVLAMHQLPLENLGLRLVLGFQESVLLMLVALPLIVFAGAAQLMLATFAKSFKEAQTYLSFTLMFPMLPGIIFSMKPMEPALWMSAVPALGQQIMTSMVLRGESIPMMYWVISIGTLTVCTVAALWYTVRLFDSEHFFKKG